MTRLAEFLGKVWEFLREACGENDYARHRARALLSGERPMTAEAFYLDKIHHKYSRPCRCC